MTQSVPNASEYIRKNPVAWFVIAFVTLLLISTYLLSRGISVWSNEIGIIAYCLLVIVVILQLKSFFERRMDEDEESNS